MKLHVDEKPANCYECIFYVRVPTETSPCKKCLLGKNYGNCPLKAENEESRGAENED